MTVPEAPKRKHLIQILHLLYKYISPTLMLFQTCMVWIVLYRIQTEALLKSLHVILLNVTSSFGGNALQVRQVT